MGDDYKSTDSLMEKWAKERKYELAKRKLWQEIRADWHLKVGDNQAIYDKLAVIWKAGYDKGYNNVRGNDGNTL